MRPLLELGVISWINANSQRAHDLCLKAVDTTDEDAIEQFVLATQTTIAQLEELGQAAYDSGCLHKRSERTIALSSTVTTSILRAVYPGWNQVDGTMMKGAEDSKRRYGIGTTSQNFSCSVDVTIKAAINLDVGRRQIDQISMEQEAHLNIAAILLRRIVSKPWGLLTRTQRSNLRNLFHQKLEQMDGVRYPLGKFTEVCDVLQASFHRLPQVSYTWSTAQVCCDGVLAISKDTPAIRGTGFELLKHSETTVQQQLTAMLTLINPISVSRQCKQGSSCSMVVHEGCIVLDRMPPTLLLFTHGITQRMSGQVGLFNNIDLAYQTPTGYKAISYRPQGCIVMVNGNHFVLRWLEEHESTSRIVHYNSALSAEVEEVEGWWDVLGYKAAVVVMFYNQV